MKSNQKRKREQTIFNTQISTLRRLTEKEVASALRNFLDIAFISWKVVLYSKQTSRNNRTRTLNCRTIVQLAILFKLQDPSYYSVHSPPITCRILFTRLNNVRQIAERATKAHDKWVFQRMSHLLNSTVKIPIHGTKGSIQREAHTRNKTLHAIDTSSRNQLAKKAIELQEKKKKTQKLHPPRKHRSSPRAQEFTNHAQERQFKPAMS